MAGRTFGRTDDAGGDDRQPERGRRAWSRRRAWRAWAIHVAVLTAVALAAPGGP